MSKQVNVDFVTRQIEVDTDGKEHFISAAMAAKDAEQSMLSAQNAAKEVKEIYGDGNFTPLSDLLGSLGTKLKRWGSIFANKVFASNLPIVYNNVAEMKADTMLWEGMNTKTLGYYTPNDGGGASYLIRAKADSDTVDNGSLHDLANGFVAELIIENGTVNVKQFGAKGNGVTDDYLALENLYQSFKIKGVFVVIPAGVYIISKTLDITVPTTMSERAYLKSNAVVDYVCILRSRNNDDVDDPKWHFNSDYRINADGNGLAKCGIGVGFCRQSKLHLQSRNCTEKGINTGYILSGNNENLIDCYVFNSPTGVYIDGADNVYGEIVTVGCPVGVECTGQDVHINSIHSWLTDMDAQYLNSILLKANSNTRVSINWVCLDSMNYGFKMGYNCNIHVNHLFAVYGDISSIADENKPKLYNYPYTNASIISIDSINVQINGERVTERFPLWVYNKYVITKFGSNLDFQFDSADINTLPSVGVFLVNGTIPSLNVTNVDVICEANDHMLTQTIFIDNGIVYKRRKATWVETWGSWYKYEGVAVA